MIEVTQRGGIAIVTMAYGKANALDIEFCEAIVAQFEASTGVRLKIEYATAGAIVDRLEKGDIADVAVASTTQIDELLGKGKVVLFAVPGAFTPGCSKVHLPGYVQDAQKLVDAGVSTIACVAVNDAFVMAAWAEAQGVDGKILMLADGNGRFTEAMDLKMDGSGFGLGSRSQRYAAIIEDGVITQLAVEPKSGVDVSACSNILKMLV